MTDQIQNYSFALIPGDGMGVEVVEAALQVLDASAASSEVYTITYTTLPWGSHVLQRDRLIHATRLPDRTTKIPRCVIWRSQSTRYASLYDRYLENTLLISLSRYT